MFTSHRALREAAELLEAECDFPVLVQGDVPRDTLLEQFRQAGNAIWANGGGDNSNATGKPPKRVPVKGLINNHNDS